METVCCTFNSYNAVPLLQKAVPLIPQIDQLIVKKGEELEALYRRLSYILKPRRF